MFAGCLLVANAAGRGLAAGRSEKPTPLEPWPWATRLSACRRDDQAPGGWNDHAHVVVNRIGSSSRIRALARVQARCMEAGKE